MQHWLSILGIVAPLVAAAAVAVWRRNDDALAVALKANEALRDQRIDARFAALEARIAEHHADVLDRFERANELDSKLASMVQGMLDLRPRLETLERHR